MNSSAYRICQDEHGVMLRVPRVHVSRSPISINEQAPPAGSPEEQKQRRDLYEVAVSLGFTEAAGARGAMSDLSRCQRLRHLDKFDSCFHSGYKEQRKSDFTRPNCE